VIGELAGVRLLQAVFDLRNQAQPFDRIVRVCSASMARCLTVSLGIR
jgi:hypothetical protein